MSNFFAALGSDSDSDGNVKSGKKVTKPKGAKAVTQTRTTTTKKQPVKRTEQNKTNDKTPRTNQQTIKREDNTHRNRNRERNQLNEMSVANDRDKEKSLHQKDYRNSHNQRGRGRGGYRGGARGGGGGGGGGYRGKREFDRRSGTGRGKEMKKDGHGAHNWGDTQDDLEVQEVLNQNTAESSVQPDGNPVEADGEAVPAENEEPEEPKEEEKPQFTLDEYMSRKSEKRGGLGFEELDDIQVEEVKDGRAYAKKNAAEVDDADAYFVGGKETNKKNKDKGSAKRKSEKVKVDTGFTVKSGRERDRGDRGGRGGYRGGRGRGRFNHSGTSFRGRGYRRGGGTGVDTSESNFPSLGS